MQSPTSSRPESMADSIDLNTLINRITCDQLPLDKINGRKLILFMGTSNAGKTTTACFLSGRQLTIKQDTYEDPDGDVIVGDEVIDTKVCYDDFKIGHSNDSTTKSIQVCNLSEYDCLLVDSCGFEDTEGCTVDISNAIALKNAMIQSSLFHPVVVVDVRGIDIGKGVPFTKLLQLVVRFFSPLPNFLDSISFLFTHANPQVNSMSVQRSLSKLLNASHIKESPDMNAIVSYLYRFVKTAGDRCIVYAEDITSADSNVAENKRRDILSLILSCEPVSNETKCHLGCPLSSEAQTGLLERCTTLCYSVEKSLQEKHYKAAAQDMTILDTLNGALNLPAITNLFDKATQSVRTHISTLNESACKCLEELRDVGALNLALHQLRNAIALQQHINARAMYETLKADLNHSTKKIADQVSTGTNATYYDELPLLDILLEVKNVLSEYLFRDYYGEANSAIRTRIQTQLKACESGLFQFNKAIEYRRDAGSDAELGKYKYIEKEQKKKQKEKNKKKLASVPLSDITNSIQDVLLYGRDVSANVSSYLSTKKTLPSDVSTSVLSLEDICIDTTLVFANPSSEEVVMFEDIFVAMTGLQSVKCLHVHATPAQHEYYSNLQNGFIACLQSLQSLILGEKGLLSRIATITASTEECYCLTKVQRLLSDCFRQGANDHIVDPTLHNLDHTVISRILDVLLDHTKTIEECAFRKEYEAISPILKILSNLDLECEDLVKFRQQHLAHRIDMVRESLQALHADIEKAVVSLRGRDVFEFSDVADLVSKFTTLQRADGLDVYLFFQTLDPVTSSCATHDTLEMWLGDHLKSIHQLWSKSFDALINILANDAELHRNCDFVNSIFARIDRLSLLNAILPCVRHDITTIRETVKRKIENVVKTEIDDQKSGAQSLQLLELNEALCHLLELLIQSTLASECVEISKAHGAEIQYLQAWRHKAITFLQERQGATKASCRDAVVNKDGRQLGRCLDELLEYSELVGFNVYLKPEPCAVYEDTRGDIKQEIAAMIASSEHAVERGELEKAAAIRVFLEGSAAFDKHFRDIDFRMYCSNLLQKHRRATDQMPEEIGALLEKHKFNAIKSKLRNLMSQNAQDNGPTDPADRLILEDISEQLSEWFDELHSQILDHSSSELSDLELASKMEAYLRVVGSAMVLDGLPMECGPLQLLNLLYSICDNQYKQLEKRLATMLAGHRFGQASTVFNQLKRLKNVDRTLSRHLPSLPSDASLFEPRIKNAISTRVVSIDRAALDACSSYLPSVEALCRDEDGTSTCPDLNGLTTLFSNIRTAVTASDVLMDDLVDFRAVQNKLVAAVNDFISSVLKRVQIEIGTAKGNLIVAERLLESGDNVFATVYGNIDETFVSGKLKQNLDTQRNALTARQNSEVNCTTFLPQRIEKSVKMLQLVRHSDYGSYTQQLGAIGEAFRQEIAPMKSIMQERGIMHQRDDVANVFRFISAVLIFQQYLQSEESQHEMITNCDDCIKWFQEFISEDVYAACDALSANRDVASVEEHLTFMKSRLSVLQTYLSGEILEYVERAVDFCENYVEQSGNIKAEIQEDAEHLRNFDLFSVQDATGNVQKLERLLLQQSAKHRRDTAGLGAKQSSKSDDEGFNIVLSNISNQLQRVVGKMESCMRNGNYDSIKNAFKNISALERFKPLAVPAMDAMREMVSYVQSCGARISDSFREAVRSRNFRDMNTAISEASVIDKDLLTQLPKRFIPVMNEVKEHFETELSALSGEASRAANTDLTGHAYILFLIKELLSEISNTDIQNLGEACIRKYLAVLKRSDVDFLQLGLILLNDHGALGAEITEQNAEFSSALTKRFNESTAGITIEHALDELKRLNSNISDEQISSLRKMAKSYRDVYDEDLNRYLPGYASIHVEESSVLAENIKRVASKLRNGSKQKGLVELLAHVFALYSIVSSKNMFSGSGNDKACIIKPHSVQIIALFRLLGLDSVSGWWKTISTAFFGESVDGHLAQVGTGEGKSILLGGLSCVLALLGFDVSCASYSKHLSNRDYEAFKPLFEILGIKDHVTYSTLSDLANQVINRSGSVRDLASSFVLAGSGTANQHTVPKKKRILLIDEVDVFFSKDFFGATYNPAFNIHRPEVVELLKDVWNRRNSGLSLAAVQQTIPYRSLQSAFHISAHSLLAKEVEKMLRDVNQYNNPQYEIVPDTKGEMKIGYKSLDSVSFDSTYGYRTAFAYCFEATRLDSIRRHLNEHLTLAICCGNFSFAAIAKNGFDCIMGVTGTLDCLSNAEKIIIRDDFNISQTTIMPSIYGASKLEFKKDRDVVVELDVNRHFQTIAKDICDERVKGRPVLVYFSSTLALDLFVRSEYGQNIGDCNIVTENTENLPFFVNKATTRGTVTLMPAVFGRGLDFISRDANVDTAGGVHVIQTYFSEYLSEEIQTKGRTARQAKKGSYKLILCGVELSKALKMTPPQIQEASETSTCYDIIHMKREKMVEASIATLKRKADSAQQAHTITMNLVKVMRDPDAYSDSKRAQIIAILKNM